MRTIKLVKLVRLSIIATFMSIGFVFLSCSPTEDVSNIRVDDNSDNSNVEDNSDNSNIEDSTYTSLVFMSTDAFKIDENFETGYQYFSLEYEIFVVEFNSSDDSFVSVVELYKSKDDLIQEYYDLTLTGYDFQNSTRMSSMFSYYNSECEVPLFINEDFQSVEDFILEHHLSEKILSLFASNDNLLGGDSIDTVSNCEILK